MPITVPSGPATGKNVVPGMTKAPHPTLQPKASAQAPSGDRYAVNPFSFPFMDLSIFCCLPLLPIRFYKKKNTTDC